MPSTISQINEALDTLKLLQSGNYTKRDIDVAYRKLARTYHPDKGGTHKQFLALSKAYKIVLDSIEPPNEEPHEHRNEEPHKHRNEYQYFVYRAQKKKQQPKVKVNPSVAEALANLYTTISAVGDKLASYKGLSETIALKELREVFDNIQLSLRKDILDHEPNEAIGRLRSQANDLNVRINNIYSGPTRAFAAMVAGTFAAIALGILALIIALLPPAGLVIGTALLCGLIVTPPVGGLLFGTFCFFAAKSADKNRFEQQEEMRKIVNAINNLADSIDKNPEEIAPSLLKENPDNITSSLLLY